MAIGSAIAAQFGAVAEVTYGTRVVPTSFFEFPSESLKLQQEYIKSKGLRSNQRVQRGDRIIANKKGAGGDVTFEVGSKTFGLLWKHIFGTSVITTPGGGTLTRRHTYDLGDPLGLSMTMQVGEPDVSGVVRPFEYTGCKITDWELTQDLDALLMLKLGIDAQDESTAQTLATASYPSAFELFHYGQCVVNVAASGFNARKFTLKGNVNQKTDRYFIKGSTLKSQPIPQDQYAFTGTLEGEFESLTAYNRFVNKTLVQLDVTWTGSLIEGALNNKITLTMPQVLFTGETPDVSGQGVVAQSLPFEVVDDGSTFPIRLIWDTTDVTD